MSFALMMLVGALIDIAVGWPDGLFRRIGHPVTWMGRLIDALEARLNHGASRKATGVLTVALVLLAVLVPAWLLQTLLPGGPLGVLIGGVLAWPFLAIRSMYVHVKAVLDPLKAGLVAEARKAVAMIVGRDPSKLDQAGLSRAAIESLAENTSDGIVAPLFWGLVGGLPGLALYKAINTMDSMIGHRSPRFNDFGWAAARLDDWVNLPASRLSGLLFALAAPRRISRALRVMWRDAKAHRSPNAGWPEGAMAGALDIRLSGPRIYADRVADEPWINAGASDPGPDTLASALSMYRRVILLLLLALGLIALF